MGIVDATELVAALSMEQCAVFESRGSEGRRTLLAVACQPEELLEFACALNARPFGIQKPHRVWLRFLKQGKGLACGLRVSSGRSRQEVEVLLCEKTYEGMEFVLRQFALDPELVPAMPSSVLDVTANHLLQRMASPPAERKRQVPDVAPIVHLLFGMPGCGKTTFATRLSAQDRCVVLSHDDWIVGLLGPQPSSEDFQRFAAPVHELLWRQAEKIVQAGTDVVMDFGFWTRAERDAARARVQRMGARPVLYAFECTAEQAWGRISRRNAGAAGSSLHISEATFRVLTAKVEPLMPDEPFILVNAEA